MSIPTFIRSYRAAGAIGAHLIVAFADAANDATVTVAADNLDPLVGTTGKIGASAAGEMADITRGGLGSVTLGGTVKAGDALTSDANAKAIATTTAGDRIIGYADEPDVADDIIDYFAAPGVIGETV